MSDEVSIPVSIPLDSDGFLRRECPSCEREFKWFSHDEGDPDADLTDQYYCPLCGAPAGVDSWWTQAQLQHAEGIAGPQLDLLVRDAFADAFKGVKGMSIEANSTFSLEIPAPEPLTEPDDMMIVESPCHPHEPVKIPEGASSPIYCLVCGSAFGL